MRVRAVCVARGVVYSCAVLLRGCGCCCGGVRVAALAVTGARGVGGVRAAAAWRARWVLVEGRGWRPVVAAGGALCRLCGRRACGPPVPVLEMSLMPPQAVGAVVMAVPPWCLVRVHGVAGGPRGAAARGAVAVLVWRWR